MRLAAKGRVRDQGNAGLAMHRGRPPVPIKELVGPAGAPPVSKAVRAVPDDEARV